MDTSVFDEEQIALLNDVSEFYLDRALPIDEKNKIIGFGKVHDFYQSYISVKNGELLFTVRSTYRKKCSERKRTEFCEANRKIIFEYVQNIYDDYLKHAEEYCEASEFVKDAKRSAASGKSAYEINEEKLISCGYFTAGDLRKMSEASRLPCDSVDEDVFGELAARLIGAFEEGAEYADRVCGYDCRVDYTGMLRKYYGFSGARSTYRDLSAAFGTSRVTVSAECARRQRMTEAYFEKFSDAFMRLHEIINTVGRDEALAFVKFGLLKNYPAKAVAFVLGVMYGASVSAIVIEAAKRAKIEKPAKTKTVTVKPVAATSEEACAGFTETACFPSDAVLYEATERGCEIYDPAEMPLRIRGIYIRLLKDDATFCVECSPESEAFVLFSKKRCPDFLVTLRTGKRITVAVADTLMLAAAYWAEYIKKLEVHCAEKGYGYIVCDPTGRTREDIARIPAHTEAEREFDSMLGSPPYLIEWKELKNVRERYGLKNVDIASYILRNGLEIRLKPFYVRKPRK